MNPFHTRVANCGNGFLVVVWRIVNHEFELGIDQCLVSFGKIVANVFHQFLNSVAMKVADMASAVSPVVFAVFAQFDALIPNVCNCPVANFATNEGIVEGNNSRDQKNNE